MATAPPIPLQDAIAVPTVDRAGLNDNDSKVLAFFDRIKWTISDPWVKWFQNQTQSIQSSSQSVGSVSLTAQTASIGATQIPSGALNTGLYRATYYFRITSPGTTSSLSVTFSWTDNGVTCTKAFAANTGNLTTTHSSDAYLFGADRVSPITYATTYSSTGAAMQYKLRVVLESIPT